VTVNSPPTTRAAAIYQSARYVEVIVQQPQNLHLMTILNNQRTKTVTAWAVGGPVPTPGASIVVLNPTASDSFLLSGGLRSTYREALSSIPTMPRRPWT